MSYDEKAALKYLLELLPIPGPPGDERKVADYIRSECAALGIPRDCISNDNAQAQSEYGGNTGNLFIRLDGQTRGKRRMLATHMDTVPIAVGCKPRVEGNRVVNQAREKALGGDARAGCAALLHGLRALQAMKGNHPPVTICFTVQEEVGLVGARGLDRSRLGPELPAMAFNFDGGPSDELVTAIIGTERLNIDIEGVAAHGGEPQKGVSAALIEALALAEVGRRGWFGQVEKPEGSAKSNLGILRGGRGSNVVMPELHILAEVRSHSSDFRKTVIDAWKDAFSRAAQEVKNTDGVAGKVRFSPGPTYEPFALPDDAPVVQLAEAAARECDIEARLTSHDGGMDSNWFVAFGMPTVSVGIGCMLAHSVQEYVDLEHFANCCRLAVALATTEQKDLPPET